MLINEITHVPHGNSSVTCLHTYSTTHKYADPEWQTCTWIGISRFGDSDFLVLYTYELVMRTIESLWFSET